ncbi:MAG TPA: potassium channel family protein [Hyphomicrobiaceae bacterium]|nr:potassium channel family protein [Hyphomicrobiaceae bacterium]
MSVAPPGTDLVYFALVNYTSLGYGDVTPLEHWHERRAVVWHFCSSRGQWRAPAANRNSASRSNANEAERGTAQRPD